MKSSVLYLGLHLMHMIHGNVVESLLKLMAHSLKGEVFIVLSDDDEKSREHILLYKMYDLDDKLTIRVGSQLEREYCCVYHFLAGKRRVMEKANKINVS